MAITAAKIKKNNKNLKESCKDVPLENSFYWRTYNEKKSFVFIAY